MRRHVMPLRISIRVCKPCVAIYLDGYQYRRILPPPSACHFAHGVEHGSTFYIGPRLRGALSEHFRASVCLQYLSVTAKLLPKEARPWWSLGEAVKIADTSIPVVVLTPHHHGALGIFRSLGRLGVPVYAVEDGQSSPPLRSRYCRGVFHWDVRTAAPPVSTASLLSIADQFTQRPVLIPTDDTTAALVQENAEQLQRAYRFLLLPPGLMHRLSSKRELFFLCRECGYPTPEAGFPQSRAEILRLLEKAVFPIALKGIDDRAVLGQSKVVMRIAQTADELLRYYDTLDSQQQKNVMLQEYIPGEADSVWMFNGYFNERSECLAAFVGRKLRQRPVRTGITTLGICLQNEVVERPIRALLTSLGYRGIVDIGCRYDARDGQYKLLDVNPRIGCTFRLFVDPNGMDVVRACYLDLTGQAVHAESAREGRKWLVENLDLITLPDQLKHRKLTFGQWLRSLRGVRETAWFDWSDLSPFWAMCLSALGSFWFDRLKRRQARGSELTRPSPASGN
jgi:D-aspartate ligase